MVNVPQPERRAYDMLNIMMVTGAVTGDSGRALRCRYKWTPGAVTRIMAAPLPVSSEDLFCPEDPDSVVDDDMPEAIHLEDSPLLSMQSFVLSMSDDTASLPPLFPILSNVEWQ